MKHLIDAIPPHSLESEMAVLGSMILNPKVIPEVRDLLRVGDFYSAKNAAVFQAVIRTWDKTAEMDLVTLAAELGESLEQVGPDYLVGLAECVPSAVNFPHYAKIVADRAKVRRVIDACSAVAFDAHQDPDSDRVCSRAMAAITKATDDTGRRSDDITLGQAADRVVADLHSGRTPLLPTGIARFDEAFGGIPEVGVTVVLGVPSSGKSTLVANIASHLAMSKGKGIGVFSYEMTPDNYATIVLQAHSGVEISRLRRCSILPSVDSTYTLAGSQDECDKTTFLFSDGYPNAEQMFTRAAAWKRKGVSVIVNDYIQQNPPVDSGDSEYQIISKGMLWMRRIARQLGMCVIVVSQPTIGSARTDAPLKASDCKGSGAIWEAADTFLSVYRPCVGRPREESEGEMAWESRKRRAEIHVLKNKHFGLVGVVPADFNPALTKFVA